MDKRQLHTVSAWCRCTERWGGQSNVALSRRPQRRLALWHGQRNFWYWTWIQAGSRYLYVVVVFLLCGTLEAHVCFRIDVVARRRWRFALPSPTPVLEPNGARTILRLHFYGSPARRQPSTRSKPFRRVALSLWSLRLFRATRTSTAESGHAGLLDLFCSFTDPERRQGDQPCVAIHAHVILYLL